MNERYDRVFETVCIGGRKGYSRRSFLRTYKNARSRSLNYALVTDIEEYFRSIDHKILETVLKNRPFRVAKDVRILTMGLVRVSCPGKGIPAGTALSKWLGNAYLRALDEFLLGKECVFCRYIDDVACFFKTRKKARKALEEIRGYSRDELALGLSERKTGMYHTCQEGFRFLGFKMTGDNIKPTTENAGRFIGSIKEWTLRAKKRKLKKQPEDIT